MIKQILLVLPLVCTTFIIKAQDYVPFPSTNAIWTGSYCYQISSTTGNYKMAMYGDTVINNINYKKIFSSNDNTFDISNATYIAALRENSKQIFYIPKDSLVEFKLYDFTKQVGDTVKIYAYQHFPSYPYGSPEYRKIKITSIDSVLVDGEFRKRYYFAPSSLHQEEYWIEGIGSTFGLMQPFLSITDNGFYLRCQSVDNSETYHDTPSAFLCLGAMPTVFCNDVLSSVKENYIKKEFDIYPNPSRGKFNVSIIEDVKKVEILNEYGQIVFVKNAISNTTELSIPKLSKGVYFVKINNYPTQKIIVNK